VALCSSSANCSTMPRPPCRSAGKVAINTAIRSQARSSVKPDKTASRLMVDYSVTPIGSKAPTGADGGCIRDRLLRITRKRRNCPSRKSPKVCVRGLRATKIKNPLGGIRGAAQLLARELPEQHYVIYTDVIIEERTGLRILVDRYARPYRPPNLAAV